MHFLFVKDELCWPRVSGHDVHTFGMMSALRAAGHEISLLTVRPCEQGALGDLELVSSQIFHDDGQDIDLDEMATLQLSRLQTKFCSYWGIPASRIHQVAATAEELHADVVVAVGLDVLPYLAKVRGAQRVWYAADEWVVHHLSQFFWTRRESWNNLQVAAIKGLYEWAFAPCVDRVWLVSQRDAKATRLVMRGVATDVVPNGVNTEDYAPQNVAEIDDSCVFWGRLDFGPNLDAVRWFVHNVWRPLTHRNPAARFTVFGFKPGDEIRYLAAEFGFELITDLPDIRSQICQRQLVVLPFVSGTGIKNKLLEAASLGRPILASPVALNGVELGTDQPVFTAARPREWIAEIENLWRDPARRRQTGSAARRWVQRDYTWSSAAARVLRSLTK